MSVATSAVYQAAHDGLAQLISARAASRILERALRSERETAERISAGRMSELLLGAVFRELDGALPAEGLLRQLKGIARSVLELEGVPGPHDAPLAQPEGAEPQGAELRAPATPATSAVVPDVAAPAAAQARAAAPGSGDVRPSTLPSAGTLPSFTSASKYEPTPEATLRAFILAFAQLENVALVAALRPNGAVVEARGSGYDVATLGRMAPVSLRLLGRSGDVRSLYLAVESHQLFLLPVGPDLVVVVGNPQLNVGSIYTTFGALASNPEYGTVLKEEL